MGKIIKNGIDYGGGVAIDSALDATSMNAIANKPVAEAITQLNNDLSNIKYFPNYDDVIVNPVPNGGYTCPRAGYLVGYVVNNANLADIKINDTRIAYDNTGTNRYASAQCLVNKGDVITFTATSSSLILVGLKQSE